MLSILAFGLLIMPIRAFATPGFLDNPIPHVTSISPNSINSSALVNYTGTNIVVAITGSGFIPRSIGRVNGTDRPTTFIDPSHVLIKVLLSDTYNTDGFYINVFNGFPGGGYSNSEFFAINSPAPAASVNNNYNYSATITKYTPPANTYNNNPTYKNLSRKITKNTAPAVNNYTNNNPVNTYSNPDTGQNQNYGNIVSTALFGSNTFWPSGLTQWVLFGIIILLIIIFIRRIFSAKKHYEESPMKHA